MRVLTMAALLVCAAVVAAHAQCPDGRPPTTCEPRAQRPAPPPREARARQIVLLPFRNVTRTPANDWLVSGAPLLLGEILGQYRDLEVVPEPRLTAARRRLGISSEVVPDAAQRRRLADETGGWTSVSGNVVAIGNTLRISAESFDAASGRVTATASEQVPIGADIRPAFDRIAVKLLQPAGIALAGKPTDVVALTTRSIAAYRSYSEGIAHMQRGAYVRAEAAFREAVRRDSNFAMAWVKLGTVAIQSRGLAEFINPFGTLALAVERAAQATSQLPPRTAAGMRAIRHLFHGEIAQSREIADSIAASDPEDIDARQALASINLFDSRLDPAGHRRGSLEESVRLSKWVLSRDPGRQEVYFIPAVVYAVGAGFLGGTLPGRWRPAPNLVTDMTTRADISLRVVVGDTVAFVPDSIYRNWPEQRRAEAVQRAVQAGRTWTQQWMAANPADGDAHFWASRFEELGGDYTKSLAEFDRALALGAESAFENVRARRLYLYEMTGRYDEAAEIADSIIASGSLRVNPFNIWMDRGRVAVPAVLMRSRQWARLAALGAAMDSTVNPCMAIALAMSAMTVTIPPARLGALSDTVASHFAEAWRSPAGRCAGEWARALDTRTDPPPRPAASRRVFADAASLLAESDASGAYFGARLAMLMDTLSRETIQGTPWVDSLSRALELGARFEAERAFVDGDSLTVILRKVGQQPLMVATRQNVAPRTISFRAGIAGADSVVLGMDLTRPGSMQDTVTYGSTADFAAELRLRTAFWRTSGGTTLQGQPMVSGAGDRLQATLRGPIVAEMKRLRPATGRVYAVCPLSRSGICVAQTISIEYR